MAAGAPSARKLANGRPPDDNLSRGAVCADPAGSSQAARKRSFATVPGTAARSASKLVPADLVASRRTAPSSPERLRRESRSAGETAFWLDPTAQHRNDVPAAASSATLATPTGMPRFWPGTRSGPTSPASTASFDSPELQIDGNFTRIGKGGLPPIGRSKPSPLGVQPTLTPMLWASGPNPPANPCPTALNFHSSPLR